MKLISEFAQIQNLISDFKERSSSIYSNLYLDKNKVDLWISFEILEFEILDDTIFIQRKLPTFSNLYFISKSNESLGSALKTLQARYSNIVFVIDLIGINHLLGNLRSTLTASGFNLYTILIRMMKIPFGPIKEVTNDNIIIAESKHRSYIYFLFNKYFDPLCEQIPFETEIDEWIKKSRIIIYSSDGINVLGFLIYEKVGLTAYLRYWFVHPKFRDQKIGSILINRFLSDCNLSKRQIFWVIKSNENAVKRYEHYGFSSEALTDFVYINRNYKYEEKNN